MKKMQLYDNKEIEWKECPGCEFANHDFSLSCGIAYENDNFTLSQDWELPIPGFMVLAPKKHIISLTEFSDEERNEMITIVNKVIDILKKNNICDKCNVIFEEKRHFHIWIMPKYEWMLKCTNDIIDNLGKVQEYAKINYKKKEVFNEIKKVSDLIKNNIIIERKICG